MTQELSPAISVVRVFGRTDAADYDFTCDPIELGPRRARFRTRSDPPHIIEVAPRYVGGSLEVPTPGGSSTVCAFSFDGNYVALAAYERLPRGILIVPDDYSPSWVYSISPEERTDFDRKLETIRRQLA